MSGCDERQVKGSFSDRDENAASEDQFGKITIILPSFCKKILIIKKLIKIAKNGAQNPK